MHYSDPQHKLLHDISSNTKRMAAALEQNNRAVDRNTILVEKGDAMAEALIRLRDDIYSQHKGRADLLVSLINEHLHAWEEAKK